MSLVAGSWQRGEIVDVEMATPGEVVSDTEASHGERGRCFVGYGADQTVTGVPLSLVHLPDELVLGGKLGSQLTHRVEGVTGVRREQLDDHDKPSCQRAVQRPLRPR